MKTLLLLLTGTIAIIAIICGGMMLATPDGSSLKLSPISLSGTPFSNFIIPGLILLFVVGVSNLIATFTLMHRHKRFFIFHGCRYNNNWFDNSTNDFERLDILATVCFPDSRYHHAANFFSFKRESPNLKPVYFPESFPVLILIMTFKCR